MTGDTRLRRGARRRPFSCADAGFAGRALRLLDFGPSYGKTAGENHRLSKNGICQLTSTLKQFVAACLLGTLMLPSTAAAQGSDQSQAASETVKATHGAWEIVCASAQPELCVMRQIGKTADGKRLLEVRVRKLDGVKTKDGQAVPAAIRILTPLGTILPPGVKVSVDGSEPRTGLFEVCLPQGCIVEDPMSEEFLGRLKAGAVAKMTFGLIQQGETSIDLSLNGFTKAFGSL